MFYDHEAARTKLHIRLEALLPSLRHRATAPESLNYPAVSFLVQSQEVAPQCDGCRFPTCCRRTLRIPVSSIAGVGGQPGM